MRARNAGRQPCERRSHVPTTPYPQPGAPLVAPLPAHPCPALALLGLSAAGAGLLGGGLAHAQSVGQHSAATRLDDATPRSYDIPAGSLGASLGAFASQSGLLPSFDPELTRGRTAPALKGRYSVLEGVAASPVEHWPAGRGGNLRRLPAGRAAHVRRSPGRPVAGGGLGRRAGRSAEGNLYRAALVGVPLQRRHRPLRPGFRG
ncbi:hypothetical protein ACPA9J_04780 [Pseudomonas aeruginosa]